MSVSKSTRAAEAQSRSPSRRKSPHAGSIADRMERSPGGVASALGRLAAVKMLKDLLAEGPENCRILDDFRKRGTPQRDVVAEHLARLPVEATLGFTSMLTDVLSTCLHDGEGTPNLKWLELLAMCPPDEAVAAWERMPAEARI